MTKRGGVSFVRLGSGIAGLAAALGIVGGLAQCGSFGAEDAPADTGSDAAPGGDGPSASDGPVDGDTPTKDASCWERKFQAAVLVAKLSSPERDLRVTLSPDERTVYLSSAREGDAGGQDLYTATRPLASDPWGTVQAMTGLNTSSEDLHPSLAPDNRHLYFSSHRVGDASVGQADIYVSKRATTFDPFSTSAVVAVVNSTKDDSFSYFVPGELYFVTDRAGELRIFHATQAGLGFETPAEVEGVNQAGTLTNSPVASGDGLRLFFASTRAGSGALGDLDVWMSTRASPSEAFGAPVNVTEVNTTSEDRPSWISPDGCRLYLTSTRPGGPGNLDVWLAKR